MTLYYEEFGNKDAPLMVFLHGGGVSSWMWDKQVQHFNHYHCVTIDLPEHGRSNRSEKFSIDSAANKVIGIIEKLAKEKNVIVIGFSLGAQVLVKMLSIRPCLIDRAIINSALVKPSILYRQFIRPMVKMTYPFIKNKRFSRLQAKMLYIGEEYFQSYYHDSSQMKQQTLIGVLEENMAFTIPREFKNATTKILVTVGEKESSMMRKSAVELIHHNRNCTGVLFAGIGHGVMLADPDLFNRMIGNWIGAFTRSQSPSC